MSGADCLHRFNQLRGNGVDAAARCRHRCLRYTTLAAAWSCSSGYPRRDCAHCFGEHGSLTGRRAEPSGRDRFVSVLVLPRGCRPPRARPRDHCRRRGPRRDPRRRPDARAFRRVSMTETRLAAATAALEAAESDLRDIAYDALLARVGAENALLARRVAANASKRVPMPGRRSTCLSEHTGCRPSSPRGSRRAGPADGAFTQEERAALTAAGAIRPCRSACSSEPRPVAFQAGA